MAAPPDGVGVGEGAGADAGVNAEAGASAGWRFARLLEAPHRLAFSAAALMLAATGAWWAAVQLAIAAGVPVRWALPPGVAHGLPITFGVLPMFFAGFQFTAGPKWLRVPPVPAERLLSPLLAQLAGWGVFALAVHGRDAAFGASLGAIGLAAVAAGWAASAWRFASLVRASEADDRRHARLFVLASALGLAALGAAAFALARGDVALVRAALRFGTWAFAGLTFVTAANRMLPFFSGTGFEAVDRRWPDAMLALLGGLVVVEGAADAIDVAFGGVAWLGIGIGIGTGIGSGSALGDRILVARAIAESAGGLCVAAVAVRWAMVRGLRVRLPAMVHAGLSWFGVSLLLAGASQGLRVATDGARSLGLAPLHAFTAGFVGTILLAMVTRITVAHGGGTDTADDRLWRLFLALQAAVVLRVGAGIVDGATSLPVQAVVAAAAIGWASVFVAWTARYGPGYGRPRLVAVARASGRG